jgi:hypothetical protein
MKPGERVIWLRSPRHSILSRWKVESIPGEIVRICRRRIRIRVWMRGEERIVNVEPDNILYEAEDQVEIPVADNLIPYSDIAREISIETCKSRLGECRPEGPAVGRPDREVGIQCPPI